MPLVSQVAASSGSMVEEPDTLIEPVAPPSVPASASSSSPPHADTTTPKARMIESHARRRCLIDCTDALLGLCCRGARHAPVATGDGTEGKKRPVRGEVNQR